jgi:hypothetical protein
MTDRTLKKPKHCNKCPNYSRLKFGPWCCRFANLAHVAAKKCKKEAQTND